MGKTAGRGIHRRRMVLRLPESLFQACKLASEREHLTLSSWVRLSLSRTARGSVAWDPEGVYELLERAEVPPAPGRASTI